MSGFTKTSVWAFVTLKNSLYRNTKNKTPCFSSLLCNDSAQSLLMVRELNDLEVVAPSDACFECEVSVPVIKPPVWSLNGEPLQQSSCVLLEKMGTVHRLTLKQTSPDMTGEVEFTSGKAKSTAQLCVLSKWNMAPVWCFFIIANFPTGLSESISY